MGEKLNSDDLKIIMEMRQYGYDVLKKVFYVEPSKSLLQALRDNEIFEEFPFREEGNLIDTGINFITKFFADKKDNDDEMTSEVRWDFTQLFVGPYALPARRGSQFTAAMSICCIRIQRSRFARSISNITLSRKIILMRQTII